MSESLGRVLQKLRREQGFSQKQLCRGLCSIPTLSRIESGEREPEQMLFDSLVSRLGKDSEKWELILKENDKKLLKKRIYIEYLIQAEEWKELKETLASYKEFDGLIKNLHEQYVHLVQAILYKQEKRYEDALQSCYEGLAKTNLQVDNKNFKLVERVSRNELRLLYLVGEILYESYSEENDLTELYGYWGRILSYVEDFCTDEQYQLHFYIKAKYYLSSIAYKEKRYSNSIENFQDGMKRIREKKSIYYLDFFLVLLKKLKKIDAIIFDDNLEEINLLMQTLKWWKEKNKNLYQKENYIKPRNSVYSINEVIRNNRIVLGKTQEGLTEVEKEWGLSRQASISEIENGKRNPRKSTREACLRKLGLEERIDNFQLAIEGEDFEIQEMKNEIDFCISTNNLLKAEKILEDLKKKIDFSEVRNEQYVKEIELFIKSMREYIPYEQWKKEILSLLSLTIQDVNKIKDMLFFSQEEVFLIMNFGCMYHKHQKYIEAKKCYKYLVQYLSNNYPTSSSKIYKVLLYNLSQVYGLLGEYDKAIEKSRESIFLEILNMEAYILGREIYNIAWCYGKKMIEEKDHQKKEIHKKICKKFFRQSYVLAKFYQDQTLVEAIEEKIDIWKL